jgi:IMP cyclohydrolase
MTIEEQVDKAFRGHLTENPYPGRGLVIGRSEEDTWMIVYWIMGRSTNSRNRRFVAEGSSLKTEPVDPKLVKDPSLIIYEAMLDLPGVYLVSNGDQTRTMYETMQKGGTIEEALATREREPDAPNFTPRINGMLSFSGSSVEAVLAILKANELDPACTDRYYYYPSMPKPGFGLGLTTYRADGDPLPAFSGDPLLLPCKGKGEAVLESYWNALNAENRVSLAVKEITAQGSMSRLLIKNRFE